MKPILVEIDGQKVEGFAEWVGETIWCHVRGETYAWKPERYKPAGHFAADDSGQILAPMPGKVIKVFRKPGELISKGGTVIVMEAMKMEYVLKAPFDGTVEVVNVVEGDQVAGAQVLAQIKASDGESKA